MDRERAADSASLGTASRSNSRTTGHRVLHGALLLLLMVVPTLHPALNRWPVAQFAPVLAYGLLVAGVPRLRESAAWLRRGRLRRESILAAAVLGVGSVAALGIWAHFAHPDLHRFAARIPDGGLFVLALCGGLFAVVNATSEEVVWRGVLFDALESRIGAAAGVTIQALAFGAGHFQGVPDGTWGVALASLYGLALGTLRKREDGLLLCIAAHVCADAAIYAIVVSSLRS